MAEETTEAPTLPRVQIVNPDSAPGPALRAVNISIPTELPPVAKQQQQRDVGRNPADVMSKAGTDDVIRQLAGLRNDTKWMIRRIGPRVYNGAPVPQGIYAESEISGPCTNTIIYGYVGGGTYEIGVDEPGKPTRWYGPVEIMGEPKIHVKLDPAAASRVHSFRAGERAADAHDDEVTVYDPRVGAKVRMSKADADRFYAVLNQEPKKPADDLKSIVAEISKAFSDALNKVMAVVEAGPKKDDVAAILLDKQQKAADNELALMRERYAQEEAARKARAEERREARKAKIELARIRAEENKARIEAQYNADRAAEERRAADAAEERRRVAAEMDRIRDRQEQASQKHQDFMMGILAKHETAAPVVAQQAVSPVSGLRDLIRLQKEITSTMFPQDAPPEKKSTAAQAVMTKALDFVEGVVKEAKPIVQQYVKNHADAEARRVITANAKPATAKPKPKKMGSVTQVETKKVEEQPKEISPDALLKGIVDVAKTVRDGCVRGVPVNEVWDSLSEREPAMAAALADFSGPQQLAEQLEEMAGDASFSQALGPIQGEISETIGLIRGKHSGWAGNLINYAKSRTGKK